VFISPQHSGSPKMKEWIKIAGWVLLIPLVGLYVGMCLGAVFGAPLLHDHDLSKAVPTIEAQTLIGSLQTFVAFLTLVAIVIQAQILRRQTRIQEGQAAIQRRQTGTILRQTAILNQSTRLAKNNYLATHRPIVRVKHLFLRGQIPAKYRIEQDMVGQDHINEMDICAGEPIVAVLVFANVGNTEARIAYVGVGSRIVPSGDLLPAYPDIELHVPNGPEGDLVKPGKSIRMFAHQFGAALTESDAAAVRERSATLYCFGNVEYVDQEGRVGTTNYCHRLVLPRTGATNNLRFRVYHDPDYSYQD
jgi:hypothetical protein